MARVYEHLRLLQNQARFETGFRKQSTALVFDCSGCLARRAIRMALSSASNVPSRRRSPPAPPRVAMCGYARQNRQGSDYDAAVR